MRGDYLGERTTARKVPFCVAVPTIQLESLIRSALMMAQPWLAAVYHVPPESM
jgi:hypothetical protein